MTSKERLTAVFNHQMPDRIPIWMMFPFENESLTANVHTEDSYLNVTKYVMDYTDFIERNTVNVEFLGASGNGSVVDFLFNHPDVLVTEKREGRSFWKQVEYGDIKFERSVMTKDGKTTTTNFIRDISDVQKILSLPFEIPQINLDHFRRKAETLGDKGLHGILIIDPISVFHDICDETDFVIWAHESTSVIEKFLDMITPRLIEIYSQFLDNQIGEVFYLTGPEFLSPPMASPDVFHRLVTVYTKQILEAIRKQNKISILHCHGNVKGILNEIKLMNPDALQPIEPPPFGDCTLSEARSILGENIILMGNIEYTDLAEKEPEEITSLVRVAIEQGGKKNFILCPSTAPYEQQISERMARNYIAMIQAGVHYGQLK